MSESGPVVSNSGPLIALATVGQLDVLGSLYGSVLMPGAVFRKVTGISKRVNRSYCVAAKSVPL